MKEHEVEGLIELKDKFEARLESADEYQELAAELQKSSLELVRRTLRARGLSDDQVATIDTTIDAMKTLRSDCGFCSACITDCITCVFHAPS